MSYLEINGLNIPVAVGSDSEDELDIGTRERSFNGTLLAERLKTKRRWSRMTDPRPQLDAEAIRGLLGGHGDNWPFDTNLFSGKGLGPSSAGVNTIRPSTGADGADVVGETKYGAGAVAVDDSTTNLSEVTDTDGDSSSWTTTDCTASDDAVNFYVGAGAVKLAFAAAVNSIRGEATRQLIASPSGSTDYVVAVYAKVTVAGTDGTGRFTLQSGASTQTDTVALTLNKWVRVLDVTINTPGSPGALELLVEENTIDSGLEIVVDAIIAEQRDYSTSYVATTRAAPNLPYDMETIEPGASGFTLQCWTTGPSLAKDPATGAFLLRADITAGGGALDLIQAAAAGNDLSLRAAGATTVTAFAHPGSPWDGVYHMVTGVWIAAPPTGRAELELYFDGVLVASGAIPDSSTPAPANFDRLLVGHGSAASAPLNGIVDDLQVLPYAASAAQVAAWFAMTVAVPGFPRLRATGDFAPETSITVEGDVADVDGVDISDGAGSFLSNSEIIPFRLKEV